MIKYFYILGIFFLSIAASETKAQGYTYTPADSIFQYQAVIDTYNTGEIDVYIYFHNNSPSTVALTWRIISDTVPSGWQPGLCDNVQCYYDFDNSFFNSHTSDTIPAGDSAFLKSVFSTNCISGYGLMKAVVHPQGDANPPTTLTYKVEAVSTCTTGITEPDGNNFLQMYPNPSNDLVYLNGVALNHQITISLTDIEGRVVQTYTATGAEQMKLDISHLGAGLYLLKVIDLQNEQTFTGKVSKL